MAVTAEMRTQVTQMYVGLFGRAPDADGLGYWVQQLSGGVTLARVAQDMYNTDPARVFYPLFLTNGEIVTSFYTNVLGRAPDAEGLAYWTAQLDAKGSSATAQGEVMRDMIVAVDNYNGTDAAALTSQALFSNKVVVGEYYAVELQGGAANATAAISGVTATSDVTSDAAIQAILDDAGAGGVVGQTFTLTAGADVVNGTNGDDTITGAIGALVSSDEIHGNAGSDTLTVKVDNLTANNTAYAPIIDGVETINLEARNASATFFMTNVSGATTINVNGITNFALAGLTNSGSVTVNGGYSADLTLALAVNTATAQALTVNLDNASGTDIMFTGSDSGTTATDTLTLNAMTNWGHSSATTFSGMEKVMLNGDGNIGLNLASAVAGGLSADAVADLTAIDGSGMTGALTLRIASIDANLKGGAGADTFIMTANLNTNDTVDGGAGADVIDAILTGGYIRPIISNVETLNLLVNSTAATADLRDVSGASTLNLMLGTGLLVDKAQTSMSTINVNSSDSTANALTVQYGTAAVASDVTLGLGLGLQGTLQTAVGTATTGMGIGTITMSGNSGSLTIVTNSTAKYTAAAVELNDFTAVTLNAMNANFVVDSAVDVGTAQTLNVMAAAGKTLTIGDDLSAQGVRNFAVSAAQSAIINFNETANVNGTAATVTLVAGASAQINFSAASFSAASTFSLDAGQGATISFDGAVTENGTAAVSLVAGASGVIDFSAVSFSAANTISIGVGASGLVTADSITIGQVGATAGSGAVSLSTLNISGAGDVAIASLGTNTAVIHTAASIEVNVNMESTAANVGISGLALSDVASAATASEGSQQVSFTISGSGNFTLSAAAIDSANLSFHVDASNLASGSNVVVDLSGVNDTAAVASALFGAASGSYIGIDGVDNIELGVGSVRVDGGVGNDVITFNSAANIAHMTIDTEAGSDTILGAGAGDTILFGGAATATAETYLTAAWATGTATNTAQILTAALTSQGTAAGLTALKQLAIYTAAGDTIIEVLGTTATVTAASATFTASNYTGAEVVRITLSNKDFTAITAAFQVNSTGTGLSITLL